MRSLKNIWRARKARNAKRSSGHLDPSARSAEFHRLKGRRTPPQKGIR